MASSPSSMNLLTVIRETSLDPGYSAAEPKRPGVITLLVFALAGLMFVISAQHAIRAEPEDVAEREEIIARIQDVSSTQDALRKELTSLEDSVKHLSAANAADPALHERIESLEMLAAGGPVQGPGVRVVVDDAQNATKPSELVSDRDLRALVNGLWEAGAEAISINGHRLSVRTPIRHAGSAITVDYVSLTRPYTVEAIGNPNSLAATFGRTRGATWWNHLHANFGIRFELSVADRLNLTADPGLGVQRASATKEKP